MKALFYSIVGAVVSAIILYFAQDYLQEKKKDAQHIVQYEIQDGVLKIDKKTLAEIAQATDQFADDVTFAVISVKNVGSEPLANQAAVFRTGGEEPVGHGVLKFGSVELPGREPDSVVMKSSKNRVDLTYKLLNEGESHRFWVAYNDIGVPSFSMRTPGLTLQEGLDSHETLGWGLGEWLIAFVLAGGLFLLSVVLTYGSISAELKSRGHDLDQILKSPKVGSSQNSGTP